MRQKYRIWDKQENKWFLPTFEAHKGHVEELLITPSGDFIMRTLNHQYENVLSHESLFPDRFETVWFTGLKDKNGKDIYEGDILATWNHDPEFDIWEKDDFGLTKVYWSGQHDAWRGSKWDWEKDNESIYSLQFIEVIGNICESPFLQQPTG